MKGMLTECNLLKAILLALYEWRARLGPYSIQKYVEPKFVGSHPTI
jgi:hypothetical protein